MNPVEKKAEATPRPLEKGISISHHYIYIIDNYGGRTPYRKDAVIQMLESFDSLTARVSALEAALRKIAAYGPTGDTGHGVPKWAELALDPQKAVEIAEEALKP